MCKKGEGLVVPNFAALRAAVFPLFTKNLWGDIRPPPVGARVNPAAAEPPRHPPAAGGIKLPPFTSAKISSQRDEIEKRNFAHIFLNT